MMMTMTIKQIVCILLLINATTPTAILPPLFCSRALLLSNSARHNEYGFLRYDLFEKEMSKVCTEILKFNKPCHLDQVFLTRKHGPFLRQQVTYQGAHPRCMFNIYTLAVSNFF